MPLKTVFGNWLTFILKVTLLLGPFILSCLVGVKNVSSVYVLFLSIMDAAYFTIFLFERVSAFVLKVLVYASLLK